MSLIDSFPDDIREISKLREENPVFHEICSDFESLCTMLEQNAESGSSDVLKVQQDAQASAEALKVEIVDYLNKAN